MGNEQNKYPIMDTQLIVPESQFTKQKVSLKIQFLNYGVCTSPFQYKLHENQEQKDKQQQQLQEIFKKQYEEQLGIQFNIKRVWDVGNLDKYIRKGRYSPLYYDNVGIQHNKFFMNFQIFKQKWIEVFHITVQNLLCFELNNEKQKITIQQAKSKQFEQKYLNLMRMDWVFFRTFVMYAYRDTGLSFDEIIEKQPVRKYQQFMSSKFQTKVMDEKLKIYKLLRHLQSNKVDIFFLQQIDKNILNFIQKKTLKFRIARCKSFKSAILISQDAFKNITGQALKPLEDYNFEYLDPFQSYVGFNQNDKYVIHQSNNDQNYFEQKIDHDFKMPQFFQITRQNKIHKTISLQPTHSSFSQNSAKQQVKTFYTTDTGFAQNNKANEKEQGGKKQKVQHYKENKKKYLSSQLLKKLTWNESTIIQFIHNLILITCYIDLANEPHLLEQVASSLQKLKKEFPKHTIIVGMNVDKDLDEVVGYYIYPDVFPRKVPTVCKQKTLIQAKISKANQKLLKTADYFISSVPFQSANVIDINNNINGFQPKLIPNETHPYDHYIISANINYIRKVKKINKEEK